MKQFKLFLLTTLVSFNACNNSSDMLLGKWELKEVIPPKNASFMLVPMMTLEENAIYEFEPDQTCKTTFVVGSHRNFTGKYELRADTLFLHKPKDVKGKNSSDVYKIVSISYDSLVLHDLRTQSHKILVKQL
ncbi:MAG TPA: hypothetical protein PKA00_21095 [Saprospiraceae bacterium]|nr:hypothetical protein [Saprospiraceae bacterium]HMQ85420.1 hypothetical protein [Saprospiraceae bacterium]